MASGGCYLLGDWFAVLIQIILGFIALTTLIVKRHYESPMRPFLVWFLDFFKQCAGSTFGHFTNIFLAFLLTSRLIDADECQWYFLNYLADTTFGVIFNVSVLILIQKLSSHMPHPKFIKFGDYGTPISLYVWFIQLLIWLLIVFVGKLLILSMYLIFSESMNETMKVVFSIFKNRPKTELFIFMIIVPCFMNTLQFWIQDSFLKVDSNIVQNDIENTKVRNKYIVI